MRKRTYLLWKRILTRLCVLIGTVGVFYVLFYSHAFTILSYTFNGVPFESQGRLEETFRSFEVEKIAWLLPGNRIFSFHARAMRREVFAELPNSKVVSIYPKGPHTLAISVIPYTPAFAMAEGYALSNEGVRYKEVGSLYGLPLIEMASSTSLTSAQITELTQFVGKLQAVLFSVGTVSIDDNGDIKFFAKGNGAYIETAGTKDLDRVWSNILSAIDTDPLKSKLAASPQSLEYLDARFGNKVFYKFTTSANSAIIPETHATTTASTTVSH